MTPITTALVYAYRTTVPARAALAEVPWAELPAVMRACGCELPPEAAELVSSGVADGSARCLLGLRAVLALAGDRSRRASSHGGHTHHPQRAVAEMCAELVGLTGAALALLDVSSRICVVP